MVTIGTPKSSTATKVLLCGSGELGKEVVIELQRYGVEVIALDKYADAPAMQVAHRAYVVSMLDGKALREIVEKERPDYIVPEVEAIATDTLMELEKEGYKLEIKEYSDYVQPNTALDAGDLDANYFQHETYLKNFNEEKGTNLVSAAMIHYEPFGIFPGKTKSLKNLKNGATVAVPNDTTNEARALLLLQSEGLITLKEDAGLTATKKDIVKNPKNLEIEEIEAAQLPRSIKDVDLAVINGNYAIEAGLKVNEDALAVEDEDSVGAKTYGNVIAVRKGDEKKESIKALIKALESDTVRDYINDKYDGAVVPLF